MLAATKTIKPRSEILFFGARFFCVAERVSAADEELGAGMAFSIAELKGSV